MHRRVLPTQELFQLAIKMRAMNLECPQRNQKVIFSLTYSPQRQEVGLMLTSYDDLDYLCQLKELFAKTFVILEDDGFKMKIQRWTMTERGTFALILKFL